MLQRLNKLYLKFSPSFNLCPDTIPLTVKEHMFYCGFMPDRLQQALSRFRADRRPADGNGSAAARISAAAFRAAVEERLRGLEREMADLKGRLNGLIVLVAGTVIAQVILKLAQ